MTKVYKSKSAVSISVFFKKTGKSKRISFSPLTGGGSVYYSKDKDEQAAIEANANFGRLFKLVAVQDSPATIVKPAKKAPIVTQQPKSATDTTPATESGPAVVDEGEGAPAQEDGIPGKPAIHVKYTNVPDAKEYLATNFEDVSRTKIRTKEDVKSVAAAHNVVFDGLE